MKKKFFITVLVISHLFFFLITYLLIPKGKSSEKHDGVVLTSFYPVYLITANLLQGLPYEIDYLQAAEGGCAHDYLLTPEDRMKVDAADLVIGLGGGLDDYLYKIRRESSNSLWLEGLDYLDPEDYIYYEEIEEHDHENCDGHHHGVINGHFFVSPRLYWQISKGIGRALAEYVKEDELERLESNLDTWQVALLELQNEVEALAPSLTGVALLTQHPSFDYLAKDLGLEIAGVLQETEGQELSSAHIINLVSMIKEKKVKAIVGEPGYSDRLPKMLQKEVSIPFVILDSVASGNKKPRLDDYTLRMKKNFKVLRDLGNK